MAAIDDALNKLTTGLDETELKSIERQIAQEEKSRERKIAADAKQRA